MKKAFITILIIFILVNLLRISHMAVYDNTFSPDFHVAAWDWLPPSQYNLNEYSQKLSKLKDQNFNSVYIDVSEYVDIYESQDSNRLATFTKNIQDLLLNAQQNKIKIYAMGGAPQWVKEDYRYIPNLLLSFLFDFNNNNQYKFSGIMFDIESYNVEGAVISHIMVDYLNTINELGSSFEKLNQDNNLEIGFAVPFWLDGTNREFSQLLWNGESKHITFHVLDILNNIRNSSIIVMDYRNYLDGEDGIINNISQEIAYIKDFAPNVSIIVGFETIQIEPAKITFHSKTKKDVIDAFNKVVERYNNGSVIKGVAIHTLDSFLELQNN